MAASIWTPDEIANYPTLTKYTSPVKRSERAILGRDREMQSVFASMNRAELCNVILLASAGTGKALANGTMIPVADSRGYVPIENLEIGDSVYDEHGIPVKVLGVFPQGELDAYKVDFSDGTYTICNDEHIWHVRSVWKHKENGDYQDLTLLQIVKSGIRKRTIKKSSGKESYHTCWYVPVAKAVVRDTVDLPLDPYVLGAMLGDGSLSSPTSDNFILSSNDEFVVQKVASLIGSSGYVKSKYNYDWKFLRTDKKFYNNRECKYIQLYEICQDSSLSGLYHCKSIHRYIPEQYFFGSIDQRLALLQGLMDTDGCITGGFRANCSFCTNSRRLAVDVQRLTAGLGFRTRLKSYVRNDDYHKNKEYEIHFSVSNEDKFRLFTLPRHLNKLKDCILERNCKNNKRFDDLGIKAVTKLEEKQEMTCIYVDSESHCFQCGYNHIVTHNTALVQGCMMRDVSRRYLEVALSQMISENGTDALPGYLEALFTDVQRYGKQEKKEIVLFIDEFHRIVQASPAAVEAMKPLLADSGTRGIKVIAATTYDEFQQYVAPNQPLVERLQRINVLEPDQNTVVQILKGMAERYHVSHLFYGDSLFKAIYEYSQRYIPANAQPRKSILLMDSMIGWHRATGRKMDMKLLADVIYEQEGINVAFRVDATKIKEELDKRVLSQEFATSVIEDRLQLCVADLNDHSKPMSSFVFCGSTGVGKTEICKQMANILFETDRSLIRFDMTEYTSPESAERFRTELTARVWARPFCLILLDEIEKACREVTLLLLQVLDDGRLIDQHNREVVFTNAYIVLTTNAGSEIYKTIAQYAVDNTGSGQSMSAYQKLIRRSLTATTGTRFPPELLGRVDCIVPFQPLSEDTMKKIVNMKLNKLIQRVLRKHGIRLYVDENVTKYLVEDRMDTDSDAGGARAVMSKLEAEVTTALSRFINMYPDIKNVVVKVEGRMASEHKDMLKSEAKIVVKAVRPR